jgi:hypothetical protein
MRISSTFIVGDDALAEHRNGKKERKRGNIIKGLLRFLIKWNTVKGGISFVRNPERPFEWRGI